MAAAGFSVIRVGESTWSTWEPEDGVFDLEWLAPVLDGAHGRGIHVILGTPTYAVPPWLARRYPEIAGERGTGQRIPWGARQEVDFTHPAYLFHAERVIRAVVGRYSDHHAVIGVQVDNEPGLELLHNRVFESFVDHHRHTYGDVETLNREWGLTYWSHRLSTWADLWTPDGNAQPQYDLAWRRFQARLTSDFITLAGRHRSGARAARPVRHHLHRLQPSGRRRPRPHRFPDVTAGNPYYAMQDSLALPDQSVAAQGWTTSGTWSILQSADRMYSSRQEPFLVTETNAGAIGGSAMNFPAYDGQWRQVAWAMVARGARMIEYWNWHTLHYGTETHWVGVLPHDQIPGRVYDQLSILGAELRKAGDLVAGLIPDAQGLAAPTPRSGSERPARSGPRSGTRPRLLPAHRRGLLPGCLRRPRPGPHGARHADSSRRSGPDGPGRDCSHPARAPRPPSTSPRTTSWSGCAAMAKPAVTSCSARVRPTPTRRRVHALRSSPHSCRMQPGSPTRSSPTLPACPGSVRRRRPRPAAGRPRQVGRQPCRRRGRGDRRVRAPVRGHLAGCRDGRARRGASPRSARCPTPISPVSWSNGSSRWPTTRGARSPHR